jgi:hypothetical protein
MNKNLYEWDFSRLPEEEHQKVIDLLASYDWTGLLKIHNAYKLSSNKYCCSNVKNAMYQWFTYGIEQGHIKPAES